MKVLSFIVPGTPRGKGRYRFVRAGKFIKTYTPKKTESYESLIRLSFVNSYPSFTPHEGPVAILISAYFPVPKSKPKWFREACFFEHTPFVSSPDWDNIGKVVTDALNSVAFRDDRQVFFAVTEKSYSGEPRLEVRIGLFDKVARKNILDWPIINSSSSYLLSCLLDASWQENSRSQSTE